MGACRGPRPSPPAARRPLRGRLRSRSRSRSRSSSMTTSRSLHVVGLVGPSLAAVVVAAAAAIPRRARRGASAAAAAAARPRRRPASSRLPLCTRTMARRRPETPPGRSRSRSRSPSGSVPLIPRRPAMPRRSSLDRGGGPARAAGWPQSFALPRLAALEAVTCLRARRVRARRTRGSSSCWRMGRSSASRARFCDAARLLRSLELARRRCRRATVRVAPRETSTRAPASPSRPRAARACAHGRLGERSATRRPSPRAPEPPPPARAGARSAKSACPASPGGAAVEHLDQALEDRAAPARTRRGGRPPPRRVERESRRRRRHPPPGRPLRPFRGLAVARRGAVSVLLVLRRLPPPRGASASSGR